MGCLTPLCVVWTRCLGQVIDLLVGSLDQNEPRSEVSLTPCSVSVNCLLPCTISLKRDWACGQEIDLCSRHTGANRLRAFFPMKHFARCSSRETIPTVTTVAMFSTILSTEPVWPKSKLAEVEIGRKSNRWCLLCFFFFLSFIHFVFVFLLLFSVSSFVFFLIFLFIFLKYCFFLCPKMNPEPRTLP